MLKTYKFYDKRGRRLAIFGDQTGRTTMNITIIPCSKQEVNFSKKVANQLYNDIQEGKKVVHGFTTIEVDEQKPGQSFLKWCRENYYVEVTMVAEIIYPILIKNGEYPIGKKMSVHFDFIQPTK